MKEKKSNINQIHVFVFGSQARPFKRLAAGEEGVVGVVGVVGVEGVEAGVEWAEWAGVRLGVEEREGSLRT